LRSAWGITCLKKKKKVQAHIINSSEKEEHGAHKSKMSGQKPVEKINETKTGSLKSSIISKHL
jgi:hypothetical protein